MGHAFQTAERGRARSQGRPASDAPHQVRHAPALSARLQRAPSCACGGSCPRCAAKSSLTVGPADDQYEREADRVADAVMSGRGDTASHDISRNIRRRIARRILLPWEKYDSLMPPYGTLGPSTAEAEIEQPEELQRSANGNAGAVSPGYEHSLQQAVRGGGDRLPTPTQAFMEDRLGWDFSSVRVHRDGRADTLARQVNARAFTLGPDIFFARSEYAPSTREGQRLLAHELTHVVQQADGRLSRQIQRTGCSAYPGYRAGVDRRTYNCSGLALRTYTWISPPSDVYDAIGREFDEVNSPVGNCDPGAVRFWLWDYDIHTEDDTGTIIDPTWHDFHIVGGRADSTGADPPDVLSKNGGRPIHGPGTGPSFRPAAKDRALDIDDNPATTPAGRPLYKVRSNMHEQISCGACR